MADKPALDPAVAADLGELLHELSHNPKTRSIIGGAIRDVAPESKHARAFKDLDIEDRFDTFKREQEEKEVKAEQQRVLDRMNGQRSALLTGGPNGNGRKYSEDDVKKIEALMERKGVTDYEDGATLYAATLPPESPQPSDAAPKHGATWEFPEWAKFSKNHQLAARDTAYQVLDEIRRKRA